MSSTWAIEADGTRTYQEYVSPTRRILIDKAAKRKAADAVRKAAEAVKVKKPRPRVDRRDIFQKMKPHERLEMAMDRAAVDDMGRFEVAALADNECAHGALPGDPGLSCSCWGVLSLPALPYEEALTGLRLPTHAIDHPYV